MIECLKKFRKDGVTNPKGNKKPNYATQRLRTRHFLYSLDTWSIEKWRVDLQLFYDLEFSRRPSKNCFIIASVPKSFNRH